MALNLSTDKTKLKDACLKCLEKFKQLSPPAEWLDYIQEKVTLTEYESYVDNTMVLLNR